MVSLVVLTADSSKSLSLAGDIANQTYKDWELIYATEPGIVNAMNIALGKAKGDIFVRIDDDVRLDPFWLERIVEQFNSPAVGGVTGPTFVPEERRKYRDSIRIAGNPGKFLSWMFDNDPYAAAKIYKCGSVSYGSNYIEHCTAPADYECDHLEGTNWAMRTELIRKVGGFDPKFDGVAEWFDTDVEQKIKKLGYKLRYWSGAYVWHWLEKGKHYNDRFVGFGRIKNWLRFHWRHSKFHPKMIIWFTMMVGYITWGNVKALRRFL